MRALPTSFVLKALTSCVLLSLSAGALAQQDPPPPPAPPAPSVPVVATTPLQPGAAAVAAERPEAGAPKSYAEVSRGATVVPGFFKLLKKDDKVWVEIRPEQLDKPFFVTVNTLAGVGERGLYGSQMGESYVAVFKKIGNQVQLIAKNTDYVAAPNTPQAHAVAQAFSDSLIASAAAASQPHPQSKAFLVEANALLFADIPNYLVRLEAAYRMPFAFDARNTSFTRVRADDMLTGFQVNAHYAVPKLSAPPLVSTPVPLPSPPTTTPDPRSMFLGFYYSFAQLPSVPMAFRKADDRIGHFASSLDDFTDDLAPKTAHHAVSRWRLEKKDPAAAMSEPVQPIVYWLDKNIPQKYRKSIAEGVLAWNAAFEKIGFRNAVVVKQQTEDDDFDTLDARHASIRWFVGSDVGFAIGPRRVDPRSGEILDADIGMSDVFARGARRMVNEDGAMPAAFSADRCEMAVEGAQEMGFALDLLEARGDFEPGSPQAEAVAQAYVKSVIMHEIGHTLGLRHNFRSSTIHTLAQLNDPAYTQKNGMAGSVMDYTPFNLALKGQKQGEYVQSVLGPYDYWAIEYAYKQIAPEQEKAELAKIAARSSEPLLAYGTDEDAGGAISDPDVNVFDLGSDPLAYFQRRLAMSRELWDRLQERKLKDGESYETLRRSFDYGFSQFARTLPVVTKYVGGVTWLRDHAGTGRATFTPVPVARQRAALGMLTENLFKADSFRFTPALLSHLGSDRFDRRARADVSVNSRVLALQAAALDQLLSDAVAVRVLEAQEKTADSKRLLSLGELYGTVQNAVWSELKTGKEITGMRRNLQREHLKRVANALVKGGATTPADARSLQRENALALQRDIRAAMDKQSSREARAHLSESYETLGQALRANMVRAGA
jgi:hypothetical protein